jgi:hypothetical protein
MVLFGHPTPSNRLLASPLGLVGHTPNRSDWMAGDSKNLRVSLVALSTWCEARMGLTTPGLHVYLAKSIHAILPSSMDTLWADSNSYNLSELNTIQGGIASPCLSSSLPFCVRFSRALRTGEPALIAKQQHSILGSWLAVTQVGFAPTCLQTISSTHVHHFVRTSSGFDSSLGMKKSKRSHER